MPTQIAHVMPSTFITATCLLPAPLRTSSRPGVRPGSSPRASVPPPAAAALPALIPARGSPPGDEAAAASPPLSGQSIFISALERCAVAEAFCVASSPVPILFLRGVVVFLPSCCRVSVPLGVIFDIYRSWCDVAGMYVLCAG